MLYTATYLMPEGERLVDISNLAESGMILAKPVLHKGAIYIGAADTYFYCIDAETGTKK